MAQLLKDLPIGALVKDPNSFLFGSPIIWRVVDKNHATYPTNSVTLLSEYLIAKKSYDAVEPNNTDADRTKHGNNNYSVSNIRQWLNSEAKNCEWYNAQHDADAVSESAAIDPGFLYDFSADFKAGLLDTTLECLLSNVDGGGTTTITDKIFLPSVTEISGKYQCDVTDGTRLAYFTNDSVSLKTTYTEAAKKNAGLVANPSYVEYCFRTPMLDSSYYLYCADYSFGAPVGSFPTNNGIRPMCNMMDSLSVSDEVDANGCYTFNFTPAAPGFVDGKGLARILEHINNKFGNGNGSIDTEVGTIHVINDTVSEYTDDILTNLLPNLKPVLADYNSGKKVSVILNIECDSDRSGLYMITSDTTADKLELVQAHKRISWDTGASESSIGTQWYGIRAYVGEDVVPSISWRNGSGGASWGSYLATGTDYETPYVPEYDGSPATKKYVDDAITNAINTSITTVLGGEY